MVGSVESPRRGVWHITDLCLDADEIGQDFPVEIGLVSDPKLTRDKVANALVTTLTPAQKGAAKARVDKLAAAKEKDLAEQLKEDRAVWDDVPMHPSRFMAELAEQLPKDAIIFDGALTSSPELVRYLPPEIPGHYFQTRGGHQRQKTQILV